MTRDERAHLLGERLLGRPQERIGAGTNVKGKESQRATEEDGSKVEDEWLRRRRRGRV